MGVYKVVALVAVDRIVATVGIDVVIASQSSYRIGAIGALYGDVRVGGTGALAGVGVLVPHAVAGNASSIGHSAGHNQRSRHSYKQ